MALVVVIVGAALYWQAAMKVAAPAGEAMVRRARIVGVVVFLSGVVTFGLNVMGY